MSTMLTDDVVGVLLKAKGVLGNIPVALWDNETNNYYSLHLEHFELQTMEDGSKRITVGINGFDDDGEPVPVSREGLNLDNLPTAEVNDPSTLQSLGTLRDIFEHEELSLYPIADWKIEVANGDTVLGYFEWAAHCNDRDAGFVNEKE